VNRNIDTILTAYRNGLTADMLQAQVDGEWGGYWTLPPCSPDFSGRAARQFGRSRAQSLRHFRRAILTKHGQESRQVVVITELPSREQSVYCLDTFRPITLPQFLNDAALAALIEAFSPSAYFPLIEALSSLPVARE